MNWCDRKYYLPKNEYANCLIKVVSYNKVHFAIGWVDLKHSGFVCGGDSTYEGCEQFIPFTGPQYNGNTVIEIDYVYWVYLDDIDNFLK